MNIKVCRECRYYMIDDGREILCSFGNSVSYLEVKTDCYGYAVCRCPRELVFDITTGIRIEGNYV